jgi:putative flippase GtrA
MKRGDYRTIMLRWCKFNFVGGVGIAVQFAVLFVMKKLLGFDYLISTAVAVEAAVVHNFAWHERFTWADRVHISGRASLARLLRFNLTTGTVSILGNLALMGVMVGWGHMNYLLANGIAIALCSIANFLVSDEWVFENEHRFRKSKSPPCLRTKNRRQGWGTR